MKLTIKQLLEGADALKRLGDKGVKDLTYKVFYSVGKNVEPIYKEIERYNKEYQRIFEEFSVEQPEGGKGIPAKDAMNFNHTIEEAQAVEVEIDIRKIAMTEELMEKAEIKAVDIYALGWMFELPEE
jgi:hypothetical protein